MEAVKETSAAQQNQQVTTQQTTEEKPKDAKDFETFLKGVLAPDAAGNVSEEELFAGVVQQRIAELKGDELGTEYKSALDSQSTTLKKPDGYVPFEDAAKAALLGLQTSGKLTEDEANKIYSEAFAAAQLDDNANALYDNRGGGNDPTIAVLAVDGAIGKARSVIDAYTGGKSSATLRSLSEASTGWTEKNSGSAGAMTGGTLTSLPGATGTVTGAHEPSGTKFDGSGGFLFKPESNNEGTLAVLLPEALAHQVTSVTLKDATGAILDTGHSTGFGDTGEREKFSFSKQGGEYPANLTVEVTLNDGTTTSYLIPDPSQRYD